jgi:hypothetical protein
MKQSREPHPDLIRFLAAYPAEVADLFLKTRETVLTAAPTANEIIIDAFSAVAAAYTWTERHQDAFCHIAAYSSYVNLGFNRGTELPDPERLLKGTGNFARHITIRVVEDLDSTALKRLIKEAIAEVKERGHFRAGKRIEPKTVVLKGATKKRRPV